MKSIAEILFEGRVETLKTMFPSIAEDLFNASVESDPTPNKQYLQWILQKVKSNNIRGQEDLPRTKEALTLFNLNKNKLQQKDINQYKTLQDLESAVEPYENKKVVSNRQKLEKVKSTGAEKFLDIPEWTVLKVKSAKALCTYGKNTKWCTSNIDTAREYIEEYGFLYIFINKKENKKYQATPDFDQFMDERDREVDIEKVLGTPSGQTCVEGLIKNLIDKPVYIQNLNSICQFSELLHERSELFESYLEKLGMEKLVAVINRYAHDDYHYYAESIIQAIEQYIQDQVARSNKRWKFAEEFLMSFYNSKEMFAYISATDIYQTTMDYIEQCMGSEPYYFSNMLLSNFSNLLSKQSNLSKFNLGRDDIIESISEIVRIISYQFYKGKRWQQLERFFESIVKNDSMMKSLNRADKISLSELARDYVRSMLKLSYNSTTHSKRFKSYMKKFPEESKVLKTLLSLTLDTKNYLNNWLLNPPKPTPEQILGV